MTISVERNHQFNETYEKYCKLVHRLSLKYCDYDDMLAEDATQYAFMQLYIEMAKGEEIANVKTYLHTVVKNYTLNQVKKNSRELLGEETDDDSQVKVEECEKSAEVTFLDREEQQMSKELLRAILLEMRERNPIWYRVTIEVFYKERSQLEVAKEMGMSVTSMYATVRRIRAWSNKHRVRFEDNTKNNIQKGAPEAPFC